jgi:hypothetical protein
MQLSLHERGIHIVSARALAGAAEDHVTRHEQ